MVNGSTLNIHIPQRSPFDAEHGGSALCAGWIVPAAAFTLITLRDGLSMYMDGAYILLFGLLAINLCCWLPGETLFSMCVREVLIEVRHPAA